LALFNIHGKFYAISEKCQHKQGPLSKGTIDESNIVTCPWHGWKYSIIDGKSAHEGGDSVDSYETSVVSDRVFVNPLPAAKGNRVSKPHARYAALEKAVDSHLNQTVETAYRRVRVLGISTTNLNDKVASRPSTSEAALEYALNYAGDQLAGDTVMIRLRQLNFKDCEGYYSKNARACIFPCSISEMDEEDQMIEVYERMILWADVVIVASPIRWGSASSLYYKMVQRLNCVQNQAPTHNRFLIRDKVAAFIITGGQDNVQHVAGEMMSFWTQLGFILGKFPFVGWSRGWYAEDTQNNKDAMEKEERFEADVRKMVLGATKMSGLLRDARYDEKLLDRMEFH
jgi:nitrite reductase/ring-hydroxylating ferredoxin subunit/multimeric flavodoxin WrbA